MRALHKYYANIILSPINQKNQVFKIIFKKIIKREALNHIIDFKKIIQQKRAPFYENTCSFDELDEKPNHSKFSKFGNFEKKGCKAKNSFFKPFDKRTIFNGFKMSNFKCSSHV
jgi:hypothetical protein